jgi:hypothetical protein
MLLGAAAFCHNIFKQKLQIRVYITAVIRMEVFIVSKCDGIEKRDNADFNPIISISPKRDEVTGEWRKLHNEELNDLHSLPNIVRVVKSRRMRWAGHVAHMGEGRGVHRVLVGKPEGKRSLGRPRRRWEDNIKMDLQEVGGGCGDWMEQVQDRDRWRALVSTVMKFRVP